MLISTLGQVSVGIGTFLGVKRMCELPVVQLKESGFPSAWGESLGLGAGWLQDLTVMDPTYVLPCVVTAVVQAQVWVRVLVLFELSEY